MLDSDFWKDLEKQFRSIEEPRLHFFWIDVPTSTQLESWDCSSPGTALHTARMRFEVVARRAGTKTDPRSADSLAAWLSRLKREGRQDLVKYFDPPGRGQIQCVCAVSADYCLKLESIALEREKVARYEEERQSDPRNWSQLRQHWEAFKSIKKLQSEPPERIPEAVVREALGRQFGVKPEDVTWEQMRDEVSGLLKHYPAITIVPTDPHSSFAAEATPQKTDSTITSGGGPDCKARRMAEVAAFLGECNKHSKTRIFKRHIWLSAGHRKGRQFEHWQACDDEATEADNRNFPRILRMNPQGFLALLRQKNLIQ